MLERRSHRIVLLGVVLLLHWPLLRWLLLSLYLEPVPARSGSALRIEYITREPAPADRPESLLRLRRSTAASSPPEQSAPADHARAAAAVDAGTAAAQPWIPEGHGIVGDDGRVRVSPQLVEHLDALAAEAAAREARERLSFARPAGDAALMAPRRPAIEVQHTVFSEAWMPEGMNPVEEACWRSRALAFVLSSLGSTDCAAPGQAPARPPPAMIVYGRDDAATVLRKSEEWARYEQRR